MTHGAAHPMGPLKLLDFVGLDVAMAIGDALHDETNEQRHAPPQLLRALVGERRYGRRADRASTSTERARLGLA